MVARSRRPEARRQHLVQRLEEHFRVRHPGQRAGERDLEAVARHAIRGAALRNAGPGLVAVGQMDHAARTGAREPLGMGPRRGEREVAALEHRALERPLSRAVPGGGRLAEREADPRVAEVRHPWNGGAAPDRERGEMDAVGRRARQHDVDVAARDPRRGRAARPRRPANVGVGEQPPVAEPSQPAEHAPGALPLAAAAAQPEPRRERAAPAHAQHLGGLGHARLERGIPHPVVGGRRAHHGAAPAVPGQMTREAEHAMHPPAGERRIEVAQDQHPARRGHAPPATGAPGAGAASSSAAKRASTRAMLVRQSARDSTSARLRVRALAAHAGS